MKTYSLVRFNLGLNVLKLEEGFLLTLDFKIRSVLHMLLFFIKQKSLIRLNCISVDPKTVLEGLKYP